MQWIGWTFKTSSAEPQHGVEAIRGIVISLVVEFLYRAVMYTAPERNRNMTLVLPRSGI